MIPDGNDKKPGALEEALERFVKAYVRGEPLDVDEFVEKYPEHEVQIRQRVRSLCEVDALFDSILQGDAGDFEEGAERNLVGQTVGSFVITEMIGRGGMGVVYLAHDTKLKRSVAIKGIPSKLACGTMAKTRFRREAELLASLNHPNIAVIHDIIEDEEKTGYLVLEYIPGETLSKRIAREPLTVEQALSIGRQIADAVSAAHREGVVHSDLKPGNIKITPDGQVKVLDFGLAKSLVAEAEGAEATSTQRHHIVGTPAYMSPEQARGQSTDHRTDIWSFACILYHMLTGKLPFEGKTATDTLAGIIEREPDWELLPKETPENIRTLLRSCLEKDPDKRLDNIEEAAAKISDALSKLLTVPARVISPRLKRAVMIAGTIVVVALFSFGAWFTFYRQPPSREIQLVVLPFENLGPAEQEYFAGGMTDEITTRLGFIHGLAVISRQSAVEFKQMGIHLARKSYDFDYFLEGTVQCETPSDPNSQVRIRIQLVNADDSTQVWQKQYQCDMSKIFDVQIDIAERVARALDIALLEPQRKALAYGDTDNMKAYNCILQGHKYFSDWTMQGNVKAIEMYEKAIELEPDYARAHATLSNALTQMYWFHGRNPELLPRAKKEADEAIKLDPDHAGAHVSLGRYYYQGCLNYEKALAQFEIALKSYPNHTGALYWSGSALQRQGKFVQALENFKRACELHPTYANYLSATAYTCAFLRRYEKSEHYSKLAIGLAPDTIRHYVRLAWTYLEWGGDTKQARKVLNQALLNVKEGANEKDLEDVYYVLVLVDVYEDKYSDALEKLASGQGDIDNMALFVPEVLRRAEIYGYMGNEELKQQYYQAAVDLLMKKVGEYPDADRFRSALGKAYAGVGRKKDAIIQGKLGTKYCPMSKDAMIGPIRIEELAQIYVMVGDFQEAIDQIGLLLNGTTEYTSHLFKIDPIWDPLRAEPRFKELIEEAE